MTNPIARSVINDICFRGGDATHQQEAAKAWERLKNVKNRLQQHVMIQELKKKLYALFPLYPIPDPQGMIFPDNWEAGEDCAVLRGKSWLQIQPDELQLHWTALSWLDAEYFHYYLPCVISLSLQEIIEYNRLSKTELPVDSVFYYITLGDVFDEKWRSFTQDQLNIVKIWHSFILEKENAPGREWHMKNMEDLIRRIYPNYDSK